jgi:Spy/CpxP family protein refolding chaperone
MKSGAVLTSALVVASVLVWSAAGQPPGGPGGQPPGGPGGQRGGPGGRGMRPGEIMPVMFQEALKLTDEQKKQFADLQKEVDEKVAKLLTDDQKAQFKKLKESGAGGPGRGGPGGQRPGGPPPGGPGGPPPSGPGGE